MGNCILFPPSLGGTLFRNPECQDCPLPASPYPELCLPPPAICRHEASGQILSIWNVKQALNKYLLHSFECVRMAYSILSDLSCSFYLQIISLNLEMKDAQILVNFLHSPWVQSDNCVWYIFLKLQLFSTVGFSKCLD